MVRFIIRRVYIEIVRFIIRRVYIEMVGLLLDVFILRWWGYY